MNNHVDEICDSEIDASKVFEVELCDLPALDALMSEESLQEWKMKWQEAIKQSDTVLGLPLPIFWSSLIYSPKLLRFIDSFLDIYPRRWELNEMSLYMSCDPLVLSLTVDLYEKLLLIILRVVIHQENKASLSDEFYSRIIYDHKIFTLERLFDIINVFSTSNSSAVSDILKKTIGIQRKYMNDTNSYIDMCVQRVDSVAAELNSLTEYPFEEVNSGSRVMSLLSMMIEHFEALRFILPFCCTELHNNCASLSISIASFVERLEEYLTEPVFVHLTICASQCTPRYFIRLCDELRGSALQLFHSLLSTDIADEKTIMILQEALAYESFIFYYNIVYPISMILASTVSNDDAQDLPMFLNDALTAISTRRTKAIVDALRNRGLLIQLGKPNDNKVKSILDEISELLPHFSPRFIHLCLRHFGYNKERTTNALLDTSTLPLDLRALMFTDLPSEAIASDGVPAAFTLPIGYMLWIAVRNLSNVEVVLVDDRKCCGCVGPVRSPPTHTNINRWQWLFWPSH